MATTERHPNRWLGPLALFSGLLISGVSAYFSIYGLAKIFTDTMLAGVIVFGVLEIGKLVSASWLFRNWKTSPKFLKSFMAIAVVIMMAITSLGIFGYLSKAYTDKTAPVAVQLIDQSAIDQEMTIQTDRIKQAQAQMEQMNRAINNLMDANRTTQSLNARKQMTKERDELRSEVSNAQTRMVELQKKKAANLTETQSISTDLGPITFIAKSIFGEGKEAVDKAVRYMIGLLVVVFDPLAIALLLAANFSFQHQSIEAAVRHNLVTDVPKPRRKKVTGMKAVNKNELIDYLGTSAIEEVPETMSEGNIDEIFSESK